MSPHLELTGTLDMDDRSQGDCVWCQKPSTSRFHAVGVGRDLALHALCAARLIRAYERILAGSLLDVREREGLARFLNPSVKQLADVAETHTDDRADQNYTDPRVIDS